MKWTEFYLKYFPNLQLGVQKQNVICPFHKDTEPSCSLDLETGLYYCHSCNEGGDVFKFYMKQNGCSFSAAKSAITGNRQTPVVTMTEVDIAHEKLLKSEQLQKMLFVKRGWTLDTIKKLRLGWEDERVFIPITDKEGYLKNIRKYDVLHKTKEKFKGITGHNSIRLYPEPSLGFGDHIIVFAGEPDTILAYQLGLPAITFTGGEGVFKQSLLPEFANKTVYILYDVDDAGIKAANNLSLAMTEYAKEVKLLRLPKDKLPPNGDFTDFFMYCIDKDVDFMLAWKDIVDHAITVEKPESYEAAYDDVDFYAAVKDDYYNKNIRFKAVAIGKNFSPFFAPKRIKCTCQMSKGDSCKSCRMFLTGGEATIDIKDNEMLDLIKCSETEQKTKIKNILGIVGCSLFEKEITTQTIEEIYVSPVIDSERIDRQFILRKCYTKGHNIQLNKTYSFSGKTVNDAKTQEATHIFNKQEPELTDLDKFTLTPDDIHDLKVFQPEKRGFEWVMKKMKQIHKDISCNVPEVIVGRDALMLAYDLVFHSILKFRVFDTLIEKGWMEVLAIGDTRTGKTKTAVKMCKHYRVGEYVTLESATLPGLVGGMSQVGRDITFSWGVLPINDGRLIVMDEVNGLRTNDIGNLSSIRDNGIAERTVVGSTRKTTSRVRLIWISNPRSMNTHISSYSSGIEAIRELMGRAEDIARLDFAIVVAKEDVPIDKINTLYRQSVDHVFTSDLCNKLIMWTWSRKPNQVVFDRDAEKLILEYAMEMSQKYSDNIPLVQGSVQRIKLAKLAAACAARLFSTEDGENVIVRIEHVIFVVGFLYSLYDSALFGYKDYSNYRKEEGQLKGTDTISQVISGLKDKDQFVNKMLNSNTILFDDLVDFSGLSRDTVKDFKSQLVTGNCLKRKKNFYVKTPQFVAMLKSMQKKGE